MSANFWNKSLVQRKNGVWNLESPEGLPKWRQFTSPVKLLPNFACLFHVFSPKVLSRSASCRRVPWQICPRDQAWTPTSDNQQPCCSQNWHISVQKLAETTTKNNVGCTIVKGPPCFVTLLQAFYYCAPNIRTVTTSQDTHRFLLAERIRQQVRVTSLRAWLLPERLKGSEFGQPKFSSQKCWLEEREREWKAAIITSLKNLLWFPNGPFQPDFCSPVRTQKHIQTLARLRMPWPTNRTSL